MKTISLKQQAVDILRNLDKDKRDKIYEKVEEIENPPPAIARKSNPEAVKFVFNTLQMKQKTLGEIAEEMKEEGYFDGDKDSLQIGVIPREGNKLFKVEDGWNKDTKLGLTETGEKYAHAFSNENNLTHLDKTLLLGLAPFGFIYNFLTIISQNREMGIKRQQVVEIFEDLYGASGKIQKQRALAYVSKLGLVEKQRKKETTYFPRFDERWN